MFLAGAWAGYGFHEDGIKSAVDAVTAMGELRGGVRRYGLRCAVAGYRVKGDGCGGGQWRYHSKQQQAAGKM